jgi:hypothetical protein
MRYSNKRHRGPTHRSFVIKESGYEGNIPVIVAGKPALDTPKTERAWHHIRAFFLHPTKGWRSTGPEGNRK